MLFTGTKSLTYKIKSEDIYKEFYKRKDLFDFSNSYTNKKIIGKMKNEYGEVIVIEFIGLKVKMYSIKKIDGSESSTAKGVNVTTEFNEFKDVLFNKKIIKHKMKRMQAKKHKIGTYEINKISLSYLDDKKYVLDDGVHTLAYFHKNSHKL